MLCACQQKVVEILERNSKEVSKQLINMNLLLGAEFVENLNAVGAT